MNVAPMTAHGWKFEFSDSHLLVSAEDGSQQVSLSARAAYSLLDYLYQNRDGLHDAAAQEEEEQAAQLRAEPASEHEPDVAQNE